MHTILIVISLLITTVSYGFTSVEDYYDNATELRAHFKWKKHLVLLDKTIEKTSF